MFARSDSKISFYKVWSDKGTQDKNFDDRRMAEQHAIRYSASLGSGFSNHVYFQAIDNRGQLFGEIIYENGKVWDSTENF